MAGDLQRMRERVSAAQATRKKVSIPDRFLRRVEENNRRQAAAAEAARKAALEQQKIDAEMRRDQRLQKYEQANTGQRAAYAADAAAAGFGYDTALTSQQQQGQLKRDTLQDRFETARARQLAREQEQRDFRQFGFSTAENEQQQQNTLERDAVQHGYTKERDQFQTDAERERDYRQFGYSTLRDDQQQQNTLQRDSLQQKQQRERDQMLNQFSAQEDDRQQRFTLQRDNLQNEFSTQADERQQGYTQQNMYQREAQDISARWQDQVAQARNAGFDFSERQRKEMQDLENSFRKNVINSDLEDGLKNQAFVEHQRKLSQYVPEEKVRIPQQTFDQSIVVHGRTGREFLTIRDPKGFERFEPIDMGNPQEDKQFQAQQKQQEQQVQRIQKAQFERLDKFNDLIDTLSMQSDPETGALIYKKKDGTLDREAVMKEAMNRFAPYEQNYREMYGLPPLAPFQAEADAKRAAMEKQQQAQQKQALQQRTNPYRNQVPEGVDAVSGPADRMKQPATTKMPVMSIRSPLPKDVGTKLRQMPGGEDLYNVREKHKSNSVEDQIVRYASDIVINAMMTGDTSDPGLEEAMQILEKLKKGVRVDGVNTPSVSDVGSPGF